MHKQAPLEEYLLSVIQEMKQRKDYLKGAGTIETIYLGGGTPSLLSSKQISTLLEEVFQLLPIAPAAEITLEANPENLNREYLYELTKSTPINRLSIGVQSFFDEDLQQLNRSHRAQQAIRAIDEAQELGIGNISIDLIYGIPGLSMGKWEENLRFVFEKKIPHLSCYALTIEPDTMLEKLIKRGIFPQVEDSEALAHFLRLSALIEREGYLPYEISNFCRPGFKSRHNSAYWMGIPYLGIGASAHSFDGKSRQWNLSDTDAYMRGLKNNTSYFEREILSESDRYHEYVLTRIRTLAGISEEGLETQFAKEISTYFRKKMQPWIEQGLVLYKNKHYALSLDGKFLSDRITADLFL